jgi:type IV secretion system protein TrbL
MTVINTGTSMVETIWGSPTGVSIGSSVLLAIGQVFASGWILFCFGLIAASALYLIVEAWMLIAGGKVLLAFGVSRWTASLTEGYLTFAVACGVRLMFMYLLVGVGGHIAAGWNATLTGLCKPTTEVLPFAMTYGVPPSAIAVTTCVVAVPIRELVVLMVDSLILVLLCVGLPWQAGRMISGAVGSGWGQMAEGAAIIAGANRIVRSFTRSQGASASAPRAVDSGSGAQPVMTSPATAPTVRLRPPPPPPPSAVAAPGKVTP